MPENDSENGTREEPLKEPLEESKKDEPRETAPSEEPRSSTDQEAIYLRRLIDDMTPVVVTVKGGEVVKGVIEYYDSRFIRLTRQGSPNLFIFKKDIKYLHEESPPKS